MEIRNQDMTQLMHHLLELSHDMLVKDGEFYPFAAIVTAEGELQACQADTGSDMPDVTKIIQASVDALEESLRSGEARLTGLAINVNIPAEIEAPCRDGVRMDFCSGPMISTVYFPYKVKRVGLLKRKRKVEFSKAVTAV